MPTRQQEAELAANLEAQEILKLRGYSAFVHEFGGVVFERWGVVYGHWHVLPAGFSWTPTGSVQPAWHVSTLEEAVQYCLNNMTMID